MENKVFTVWQCRECGQPSAILNRARTNWNFLMSRYESTGVCDDCHGEAEIYDNTPIQTLAHLDIN